MHVRLALRPPHKRLIHKLKVKPRLQTPEQQQKLRDIVAAYDGTLPQADSACRLHARDCKD